MSVLETVGLLVPAIAIGLSLLIALVAFWIWMLVDCLTKEAKEGNDRLLWAMVIVFTKIFGAVLYYFLRYRPRAQVSTS